MRTRSGTGGFLTYQHTSRNCNIWVSYPIHHHAVVLVLVNKGQVSPLSNTTISVGTDTFYTLSPCGIEPQPPGLAPRSLDYLDFRRVPLPAPNCT